jgi:hypothetical protein
MTTQPVICSSRHDRVNSLRLFFSLLSICLLLEPLAAFAAVSDTAKVSKSGTEESTCAMSIYCSEPTTASKSDTVADNIDVAMVRAIMSPGAIDTAFSDRLAVGPGSHDEIIVDEATCPLLKIPGQAQANLKSHADLDLSLRQTKNPFSEKISMCLPRTTIIGGIEKDEIIQASDPIVIDSDEIIETNSGASEQLPTDPDKTRVIVGARFPVVLSSQINSKTAQAGDLIEARLKNDLLIGERLVAEAGSIVIGHIDYTLKARTAMRALVSLERWYKNGGCLGITFDELINAKGEHLPLVAKPAQQASIIKNKGEGRLLGVNRDGQVVEPWSNQLKYKAVRLGLHAALVPAGVFSFGAMPVALGLMGAANPSLAYMKPVGLNVRHRRIKGFAMGVLGGVPGGLIIQDTIIRGQEAVIEPGDEFLAEFKQDFTGEPATETSLLTRASSNVQGQVLPKEKKTN